MAFRVQQKQQSTPGPRGPKRGSGVGQARPAATAENTRSPQAPTQAPAPAQPTLAVPAQQQHRVDQRATMARGRNPLISAGLSPRAPGERQAQSPATGRGSRVECWVEDERPGKQGPNAASPAAPPPPPQQVWGSTSAAPPRFPRLEPIIPRRGQAPLPGAVPENRRHIDRTPRPKF